MVGSNLLKPKNEFLANYDFNDIANGTGYEIYYGIRNAAGEYILIPTIVASEDIRSYTNISVDTTFEKAHEAQFDLSFNTPRRIKGKLFISQPIGMMVRELGDRDIEMYATAEAFHYDGTTFTQIGSTQTSKTWYEYHVPQYSKGLYEKICSFIIDGLDKNFKIGETIRLRIRVYIKSNATSVDVKVGVAHDPISRTDTTQRSSNGSATPNDYPIIVGETKMEVQIPFKIET